MRRCLSCCVSLLSAPNLEVRSEGSFRVLDVLVLLVLELEGAVLSPVPFLFAALWARGLGHVWPLSFALSWLARALFAGVSLAASDWCSQ